MSSSPAIEPNYIELVKFLVTPFLEYPESLVVDCETYAGQHKVLVRLAFAESDRGKVFGRGGRTVQAIRTLVEVSGKLAGQAAYLEVFGERESMGDNNAHRTSPVKAGSARPRPAKRDASTPQPNL